jgi:uncharacterized protein
MLDQFLRQNRWWTDPTVLRSDRHLKRLAEAKVRWCPELPFSFDQDGIYTLRGPRQVGKSTLLKRVIESLLDRGWPARSLLYLDVELAGFEKASDLVSALRAYLDAERSPAGQGQRLVLLLDEVTRVANWAGAIRGLVDNGELEGVTILATGSHTRDLRSGGERLPGRRGQAGKLDWQLLPLSFREYVSAVEAALPLPPLLGSSTPEAARAGRLESLAVHPRLAALFESYLATGGFLSAINEWAGSSRVDAELFEAYRQALIGEFTRAGLRESYLREVVSWAGPRLGREFDYRDVATETDIGSKDTARAYIDVLEATYVAAVCYRANDPAKPAPAFRGPKKLYPLDPLFYHLLRAWAAGEPDPWLAVQALLESGEESGRLVETVVASHLLRAYPGSVFYYRHDNREVDFLLGQGTASAMAIEVKYQRQVDERSAAPLVALGGGLLLTRSFEGDLAQGAVYGLPVDVYLSRVPAPALSPCRL